MNTVDTDVGRALVTNSCGTFLCRVKVLVGVCSVGHYFSLDRDGDDGVECGFVAETAMSRDVREGRESLVRLVTLEGVPIEVKEGDILKLSLEPVVLE